MNKKVVEHGEGNYGVKIELGKEIQIHWFSHPLSQNDFYEAQSSMTDVIKFSKTSR